MDLTAPPAFNLIVDGSKVPPAVLTDVVSLVCENAIDMAGMCSLTLANGDQKWSKRGLFAPGKKLEVDMGRVGELKRVMLADIVSLRLSFPERGQSLLHVLAYDKRSKLGRGVKSRAFQQKTDTEIAQQIAGEMGLQAKVDATTERHEYIYQYNQSDLEFLASRAAQLNYELRVDGGSLIFMKPAKGGAAARTLKWGQDLRSFRPRLNVGQVLTEVEVRCWDTAKKQVVIGKATAADVTEVMGGQKLGIALAEKAFGGAKEVITNEVFANKEEAECLAKAILRRRTDCLVEAHGSTGGDPSLKVGTVLEVQGVGKRFSGNYYLTKVSHSFAREGFFSFFNCKRPALEAPPPPAPQPVVAQPPRRQQLPPPAPVEPASFQIADQRSGVDLNKYEATLDGKPLKGTESKVSFRSEEVANKAGQAVTLGYNFKPGDLKPGSKVVIKVSDNTGKVTEKTFTYKGDNANEPEVPVLSRKQARKQAEETPDFERQAEQRSLDAATADKDAGSQGKGGYQPVSDADTGRPPMEQKTPSPGESGTRSGAPSTAAAAGAGAAAGAAAAAAAAASSKKGAEPPEEAKPEADEPKTTFLDFVVYDEDDQPVCNQPFELTFSDGTTRRSQTGPKGEVYEEGIPDGEVNLRLVDEPPADTPPSSDQGKTKTDSPSDAGSSSKQDTGSSATGAGAAAGAAAGAVAGGGDGGTAGEKPEEKPEEKSEEKPEEKPEDKPAEGDTFVDLKVIDDAGKPFANQSFLLIFAKGGERKGKTDAEGRISIQGVPSGDAELSFPAG